MPDPITLYESMKIHGRKEFPHDEELALLRAAQNGDLAAQNLLLQTLYFTIIKIAANTAGPTTPPDAFDDILSAGVEGAISAIHRHNLTRKARLRTFANAYVRGMVMREISKSYSPLTVPHNSVSEARALSRGSTAEDLGITDAKAFSLLAASQYHSNPCDDDFNNIHHRHHTDTDFEIMLRQCLEKLEPEAHFIVCHTYGILGFAQLPKKEIARTYGVTVRAVQAILDESTEALAELLEPSSPSY